MRRVDNPRSLPGGADVAAAADLHPRSIAGALAWQATDGAHVRLFGPGCQWHDEAGALAGLDLSTVVVWNRSEPRTQPEHGRTRRALALLDKDPGLTPYRAAQQAGVHVSAVYRALQRAALPVCECCGQRLPA